MQATSIDTLITEGYGVHALRDAGSALWPLAVCALVVAAVVVWKLVDLSVHGSRTLTLLDRIDDLIGRGMIAEAFAAARESDTPGGRVVAAGLARRAAGAGSVARSMRSATRIESIGLARGLTVLRAATVVAPLLGMLTAVLALRRWAQPAGPAAEMGLLVAIAVASVLLSLTAALLHQHLARRCANVVARIERTSGAAVAALESGASAP